MTLLARLAFVLLLLVTAAGPASAQGTLAVQIPAEPPGLDLTASPASAIAAVVHYNVQECLVKVDRNGKLVPWLADRWYTTDSKNYTFFLKKGVRFHNGREMKAADVKFVLERAANPETKHPFQKRYEIIREIIVKDDYTVSIALKSGDIDVSAFGLGPENVLDLKKDPRFQVILGDTTNDVILAMNNSKKPYSDKRVRLAITHAINKEEVLKGAMFGLGRVLGSNVDPLNPYFVDMSKAVPYDPAKAKKLLVEAGYPNGFDAVLRVSPQYYYTVRTGEVLVSQLAKVGIKVKIEQIEWGQWLSQVYKDANYDLTIIGHAEPWDIGNYANPGYYFRWDNKEFQQTVDDKKRREQFARLQKMMADEAPVVWLYMHPRLVVAKKGVTGIWKDLPISSLDLTEVAWQK